jgi:hypothetical protein
VAPGSQDNRRAHIDQICMHQQLSRHWQLAAQIDASLCQVVRAVFSLACELALFLLVSWAS